MKSFFATLVLFALSSSLPAAPVPVEDLLREAEFHTLRISPSGKYIAMISSDKDLMGIRVIDISNPASIKHVSAYRFSMLTHVQEIEWVSDERLAFSTSKDIEGFRFSNFFTWDVYTMNADGSDRVKVNPAAIMVDGLPDDPDHMLVYRNYRGPDVPEIAEINVYNGDYKVVAKSPFEEGWLYRDLEGKVRAADYYDRETRITYIAYRDDEEDNWRTKEFDFDKRVNVRGFHADNRRLVVDTGPIGLHAFDFDTGETTPLVSDDTVEAAELIYEPGTHRIEGAWFHDGKPRAAFLYPDSGTARLYKLLQSAFPGLNASISSITRDGSHAVVQVSGDVVTGEYYLFDLKSLNARYLLSSRPWLEPDQLVAMQPVHFKARDGLDLHGYLTTAHPGEPLPTVVIVHGGPHGPRDVWGYNAEVQALATRGYAVLQVNFRGSGGYGREFEEAGYKRWGTAVQDDIADGVKWAIENGHTNKERTCIYGASFGGYSVLSQLVRYPELYRCGFAFVGLYDLNLFMEAGDIQKREDGMLYLKRVLPDTPEERAAQSPIHAVKNIKAGLFVAHGDEDVRAHAKHFYELIDALEDAGVPHEKLVKYREGHGFYNSENKIELYTRLLEFVDRYLSD